MGPMVKFFSRPDSNPNINAFVNYYEQINIKKYLHQNIIIEGIRYN